jgi:hypothetical protein
MMSDSSEEEDLVRHSTQVIRQTEEQCVACVRVEELNELQRRAPHGVGRVDIIGASVELFTIWKETERGERRRDGRGRRRNSEEAEKEKE